MLKGMKIGSRVRVVMGLQSRGTVVPYIPSERYTDGQYRPPHSRERPVYVRWDDGTEGWLDRSLLQEEPT